MWHVPSPAPHGTAFPGGTCSGCSQLWGQGGQGATRLLFTWLIHQTAPVTSMFPYLNWSVPISCGACKVPGTIPPAALPRGTMHIHQAGKACRGRRTWSQATNLPFFLHGAAQLVWTWMMLQNNPAWIYSTMLPQLSSSSQSSSTSSSQPLECRRLASTLTGILDLIKSLADGIR